MKWRALSYCGVYAAALPPPQPPLPPLPPTPTPFSHPCSRVPDIESLVDVVDKVHHIIILLLHSWRTPHMTAGLARRSSTPFPASTFTGLSTCCQPGPANVSSRHFSSTSYLSLLPTDCSISQIIKDDYCLPFYNIIIYGYFQELGQRLWFLGSSVAEPCHFA
jgi:hypothetical protein